MPFKSKAQRRKFAQLLVDGEISPETFEEWNRETGREELPERVQNRSKGKTAKRKAAKRKTAKRKTTKRKTTKRKTTKRRPAKRKTAKRTAR
jgi:chromatin segregation and condensation protein Rec8/ScpA/Scc1 (kleisin family)